MNSLRFGCSALAVGALAFFGVILAGQPASAQYGSGGYGYDRPPPPDFRPPPPPPPDYYGEGRRDYGPPPPRYGGRARGSFVRSCYGINQDGSYLEATCRDRYGGERRTQIDVRECRSIGNRNGRLVCE